VINGEQCVIMLPGGTNHIAQFGQPCRKSSSARGLLKHISQPAHLYLALWYRQTLTYQLETKNCSQVQE